MPERIIEIGPRKHAEAFAVDAPDKSGASHRYMIREVPPDPQAAAKLFGHIEFQHGPVKEGRRQGCQNEQVLAIVIDRLAGFQGGQFPCIENAEAINHLKNAMTCLQARTADREARGVEGENKP